MSSCAGTGRGRPRTLPSGNTRSCEAPGVWGIPEPPASLVTRSRLLELVEQGVEGSLTLLSAPAGAGKTVLVSDWARSLPPDHPVVWLTTSPDGAAELFWSLLPDALRRSGVRVARLGPPSDARAPSEAWLTRLAGAIAAHGRPVVLVLDEGGRTHPALHRSLSTLMGSAGRSLRVVLLTRSDPVLPLNSYRLDNQLTEIRAADLSFDEDEAAELFDRTGLSLTSAQAKTLVARTSGWAGGLRLAAMGLQGKDDLAAAVADFSGDQDCVSTYLSTEVLRGQPPSMRDVLLRTSVVDALSPGLFEALTGLCDGRRAMAFMARGNAFMEAVPGFPGWYRYPSLVREFLRVQLAVEQPLLVGELHRKAGDWFARNGFLTLAARQAASEGAWDDAARYLVEDLSIGSLVAEVQASGRASTFSEMPRDEQHAAPSIVRAALALGVGDQATCGRALATARTSLVADPVNSAACTFSIAFLEALRAVTRADVETGLSSVHAAEQQLRGNYPEAAQTHPELARLLELARVRLYLWKGDLVEAAKTSDVPVEASEGDTALSSAWLSVVTLGLRALVDAFSGRLSEAVQHADQAEEIAQTAGVDVDTWSWEVPAARAWVSVEEMDLVAAADQMRLVDAGPSASSDMTGHMKEALVALVRSRLLQAQGHPQAALDVLPELDLRPTRGLVEAAGRSPWAPGKERAGGRPRRGSTRPVQVVSGPRGSSSAADPSCSNAASPRGGVLVEELTLRELEVLAHLAELLTTTEIAATMFISVNTVRTHVRSILRKLAVVRRNDAVRRAWELGLLQTRVERVSVS